MTGWFVSGLVAGAAGTTALNAVTYLDMALRGRSASTTPEQTVRRAEEITDQPLSPEGSDTESARNRRSGVGALLGISTGIGAGLAYAGVRRALPRSSLAVMSLVAGSLANVGSVAPMSALGVTDPRSWPPKSWVMDLVPHLAYGMVTAAVYDRLQQR